MKRYILLIAAFFLSGLCLGQTGRQLNRLGVSVPVVWNNSEATYYSLGNPKHPTGNAVSCGIGIHYSRSIYQESVYGKAGVGYFRQSFGIRRPVHYSSPFNLLYSTQAYSYDNVQLFAGLGYIKRLSEDYSVKGEAIYSHFNSFRQKYTIDRKSEVSQVNKTSFPIGNMVHLSMGLEKDITKKVSLSLDILLPLLTNWNDEEMFYKYDYSANTQQIARNRISVGCNISCYYHF